MQVVLRYCFVGGVTDGALVRSYLPIAVMIFQYGPEEHYSAHVGGLITAYMHT